LWDGTDCWTPPDTHITANVENMVVGPDYIYNNGTFTAPDPIIEKTNTPTLTELQTRLMTLTNQMAALANTANT